MFVPVDGVQPTSASPWRIAVHASDVLGIPVAARFTTRAPWSTNPGITPLPATHVGQRTASGRGRSATRPLTTDVTPTHSVGRLRQMWAARPASSLLMVPGRRMPATGFLSSRPDAVARASLMIRMPASTRTTATRTWTTTCRSMGTTLVASFCETSVVALVCGPCPRCTDEGGPLALRWRRDGGTPAPRTGPDGPPTMPRACA